MEELDLITQIRRKPNNSELEKLALKYYYMHVEICETLIDVSKCHVSETKALSDIKRVLSRLDTAG